ncbi:MAG: 16S rRNA (adenine(1518)-N(6)/adenine(1519)-N(6))-dimethyltransferase RsmA [Erysipelotrichaceae bacterium]|nr:16S rRNA (adenine(1518)-N(6)/adenine(1519)-N(6))-dimethyltransferase RsmA [Erysipelotrichaceae bacterium]
MNKEIATIARTSAILESFQLYPNKGYGQNFIIEPRIVQKIAENSRLDKKTAVIEIGPGIGALTEQLAKQAGYVLAFEIDGKLISVLQETLKTYDNIRIEHQDFLICDIERYYQELNQKYNKVVVSANLPYYITTPILFKLIESHIRLEAITIMVQKEIAERFTAQPSTKDYNALSVILQYLYEIKIVMRVAATVFIPKPAVDSIVVQLLPRQGLTVRDQPAFFQFIKACFSQRRKTIYNNLKTYWCDPMITEKNLALALIEPSRRAESLNLADFIRLFEVSYEA